ncbi:hypothetical protein [Nonomuraea salmonea]|uniref:Uncharacterized protein n=1 Tax=Nonomuraea salmonea TaxID=46181 RepID=A0ABV5P2K8_9ACTN
MDPVILCDVQEDGTVTRFIRAFRADGKFTDFGIDGEAYTPSGTVGVCAGGGGGGEGDGGDAGTPAEVTPAVQRQTDAGTVTVAEGARSVTLMVLAGAPTVAVGGGDAVAFPAGSSASWGVDAGGERLKGEFVITAAAGDDVIVISTRQG